MKMRTLWITAPLCVGLSPQTAYAQSFDTVSFASDPNPFSLQVESEWFGYQAGRNRDFTGNKPGISQERAYDYSVFLMKDGPAYRMYHGGRYRDVKPDGTVIDGDHVFGRWITPSAFDADPTAWNDLLPNLGYAGQELPSPLWLQPQFNGDTGKWYSNNTLEPEVIKKDGLYYMYTQVEVQPGQTLDTGQPAVRQSDRIQLYISDNSSDWLQANPNSSVVQNIPNPSSIDLGHQEMLYVPFDNTNRPWWMYVRYSEDDVFKGHVRIRTDDPSNFNWGDREQVGANFDQLGNQIGYFRDDNNIPMFTRITFTGNGAGREVPTLAFSRDGINWTYGDGAPTLLEGSQDNNRNKNTYFLGFSTIYGTGQLEEVSPGVFKLLYAASTANGPTAANNDIFYSEIGLGEMYLRLPSALPPSGVPEPTAAALLALGGAGLAARRRRA
ncbi:MAG: PEP-CTERM sorting domain-containing protein [Planctomycetota bacterium]